MNAVERLEKKITPLHVERGVQMRTLVRDGIARGLTAEQAVEDLAEYLGVDVNTVRLGIAIANEKVAV